MKPQTFPRPPRSRGALVLFLGLGAAGALADSLALELLPGLYLSFAMAAVLAAADRLGTLAGLLVLLLAKTSLPRLIGNPYGMLVYFLEVLAVPAARKAWPRASLLVVDAAYWPLLGLPLLGPLYLFALRVSPETVVLVLLKMWLSGLLNACLAGFLADSAPADLLLGRTRGPAGMGDFIKNRINLLLLPLVVLALAAILADCRSGLEAELALRLESGLERARIVLAAPAQPEEPEALLRRLRTGNPYPRGRYAIGTGEAGRPWREGYRILPAEGGSHPMDRWRGSSCFGEIESGGRRIRYLIPLEPFFLRIARLSSIAIGGSILLLYGVYAIISLASRSLARRTALLLAAARRFPERIEGGEEPSWPSFDVGELCALSEEFREASRRLSGLFSELGRSRESLEWAVEARTAELEASAAEVRRLLARVEREREEERTRLARELHDEFGQVLAGVAMGLSLIERRLGEAGGELAPRFADLRRQLAELSEGMRRIVADLRPGALDRLGLPEALAGLARERGARSGVRVDFRACPSAQIPLPSELASAAYRVAQEALSNALRHSGSDRVEISLAAREGRLSLEVADWGKGMALGEAGEGRASFGILGMRERCLAQGGGLSIVSRPGEGTRLLATFSLPGRSREWGSDLAEAAALQ